LAAADQRSTWRLFVAGTGRVLYALADGDEIPPWALFAFRRDPRSGALAPLRGDDGCIAARQIVGCHRAVMSDDAVVDIAVAPDGRALYLIGYNSLEVVRTDSATGGFRSPDRDDPPSCVTSSRTPGVSWSPGSRGWQERFSHVESGRPCAVRDVCRRVRP
jgi:hypothetical protein